MWGLIVGLIAGVIIVIGGIIAVFYNEWNPLWGIPAALVGGAAVAGLFVLFASITTLGQNEVALLRNKITGEVTVMKAPGTTVQNPLTEKLVMKTTQVEKQFGDDNPTKGKDQYIPFNANSEGGGQEFNAALNFKWEADKSVNITDSMLKLYRVIGNTNLSDSRIISTLRSKTGTILTELVKDKSVTEITAMKSELSTGLISKLKPIMQDMYGITIVQAQVHDIIAPDAVRDQIESVSKKATEVQVAEKQLQVTKQQEAAEIEMQKLAGQKAINAMLDNKFIPTMLMLGGVDPTKPLLSMADIKQGLTDAHVTATQLQSMIGDDLYYKIWDGVLPTTMAGSNAGIMVGTPSK